MRHALHRERQGLQRVHATKSERRSGYKQRGPRNHFRVWLLHHIALRFFYYHQLTQAGSAVQRDAMLLWGLVPVIDRRRKLLSHAGKQSAPPMLLRRRRSIATAALALAAAALALAAAASVTERDAASRSVCVCFAGLKPWDGSCNRSRLRPRRGSQLRLQLFARDYHVERRL